jgi:hypothetical protein
MFMVIARSFETRAYMNSALKTIFTSLVSFDFQKMPAEEMSLYCAKFDDQAVEPFGRWMNRICERFKHFTYLK